MICLGIYQKNKSSSKNNIGLGRIRNKPQNKSKRSKQRMQALSFISNFSSNVNVQDVWIRDRGFKCLKWGKFINIKSSREEEFTGLYIKDNTFNNNIQLHNLEYEIQFGKFFQKPAPGLIFYLFLANLEPQRLSCNIKESAGFCGNILVIQIDQLISFDQQKILSFDKLHLPIQSFVKTLPNPLPKLIIRFLDYKGPSHIIQNLPQNIEGTLIKNSQTIQKNESLTHQNYKNLEYHPEQYFIQRIPDNRLKQISKTAITNLNQLRVRCSANFYISFEEFVTDFQSVINWNQVYRSKSIISYLWITSIVQLFNKLTGQSFKDKFTSRKIDDITRLMKYETVFKVNCSNYPIVPTNFREYQLIHDYLPTPIERQDIIRQKMKSKKTPTQCPSDCSCLSDPSQSYCNFSLAQGTWESTCKNRQNRIQCCHSNAEEMKKCRNAEIKLKKNKTCRTAPDQEGDFDIEQCLIWGIDYYTRKNIIYTLPQYSVVERALVDNSQQKSVFVNNLLKAANFNSTEGYNMKKACQFIISHSPRQCQSQSSDYKWKYQQIVIDNECMFGSQDQFLAKHLMKILQLNLDQTAFRIHTKGKGARCLNKNGIRQSQFIIEYLGEVYEPWRWYQRQDHTKRIMRQQKLSNLPDFYNIYLEKHNDEEDGYEMLVVDPISHGNFASRFSHSCHPNCGTITTVSEGKYYIGMYALRDIQIGEELTFDYCSITQSNLQHVQAICLCGTKICRGHYLQLGNAKQMNYVLDEHNCFLNRNSVLLHSCIQRFDENDIELLGKYNIKGNMLNGCPEWLKKWASYIMQFVEFQCSQYKKTQLKKLQSINFKDYQNISDEQIKNRNELFAQVRKNDLFNMRFQNLVTSIDKLKYYLGSIKDAKSPISFQQPQVILKMLWNVNKPATKKEPESLIFNLINYFQKYGFSRQLALIQEINKYIVDEQSIQKKLYFVRLGFLVISHLLRLNSSKSQQLSDILYFYAFTHTYFTTHQYDNLDSQKMIIHFKDFLTEPSKLQNHHQVCKRQYSSQFVWGQLVAWFKQTIASPQSSLSQDRRGTLSYPTIDSITKTVTYPFEGHSRNNFFKTLLQKPFSSWPPDGCPWSYKNSTKSYGTMLFQSYFNADKFNNSQVRISQTNNKGKRLIKAVLESIDGTFQSKFLLFAQIQNILQGVNTKQSENYKQIFWGEGFEESKRSLLESKIQIEETKTILKKQKYQ